MAFEIGSQVKLKSGGPVMTVVKIEAGEIYTAWFNDKNEEKGAIFPPAALEEHHPVSLEAESHVDLEAESQIRGWANLG